MIFLCDEESNCVACVNSFLVNEFLFGLFFRLSQDSESCLKMVIEKR